MFPHFKNQFAFIDLRKEDIKLEVLKKGLFDRNEKETDSCQTFFHKNVLLSQNWREITNQVFYAKPLSDITEEVLPIQLNTGGIEVFEMLNLKITCLTDRHYIEVFDAEDLIRRNVVCLTDGQFTL